jgi:pyrimidine-nucleoside phosphorylase
MDQPLGRLAGHSYEIIESIEILKGANEPADLRELSIELSAWMFFLGERSQSLQEGRALAESLIANGHALAKFKQGIALQGGDDRIIDDPNRLPLAKSHQNVPSPSAGFITATDCEQFGIALAILGGGREKKEDQIDHAVGLEFHKRIGDAVEKGETLATIHYNSGAKLAEAQKLITDSYKIGPVAQKRQLIRRIIGN